MDTPSAPPFAQPDRSAAEAALREQSAGSPRLAVFLLAITCLTTLFAGLLFQLGFEAGATGQQPPFPDLWNSPLSLLQGLPFSMALLTILLAHEMGHYLACRYYGIRCTLPYTIPAPPFLNPFGTFGAVIRIRSPFSSSREIFDVGIAGPLAGFVFVLPMLALGIMWSTAFQWTGGESGFLIEYGEPLLFQLATHALFEGDPAGINLHPVGWAAWFGLFATSLNLLPYGQLDGGHITYALLGDRLHRRISVLTLALLVGCTLLAFRTPVYLLFAVLLLFLGPRHPEPGYHQPCDRTRWWLAWIAALILIVSFIPVPVQVLD